MPDGGYSGLVARVDLDDFFTVATLDLGTIVVNGAGNSLHAHRTEGS